MEIIWTCGKSVKGGKKTQNEDTYLIIDGTGEHCDTKERGLMFAVADGMGGHPGGAIASEMACRSLGEYYYGSEECGGVFWNAEYALKHLENVIWKTHRDLSGFSGENTGYEHMGTTLSVLVIMGEKALIAHAGDSRIYRLRLRSLKQLTDDHTLAMLSVEMGYLKPDEVRNHPLRNMLSQAVGEGLDQVQTRIEEVETGDVFLLCSDGLYGAIDDARIQDILDVHPDDRGLCGRLIDAALKKGGKDDITAIVLRI